MTRQRTISGARRTLVQRPDQVPADARQAHRLRRPGLGQRGRAGATRSICASTNPGPRLRRYFDRASMHSPTTSDSMRLRHPLNQRSARARGGAAHRLRCRHTPAPRAACPSSAWAKASNRSMSLERTRAAPASGRVWPCAGAPGRTRVSCPSRPQRLSLAFRSRHRRAAPERRRKPWVASRMST